VGGHCVGVDPFYLTSKAEALGYNPEVILAGRRINDSMGARIAQRVIRFVGEGSRPLREARVAIMGITFKENVPDIRNSRVPDIVHELARFGVSAMVSDPLAIPDEVQENYKLNLVSVTELVQLDALVLAVPHAAYLGDPLTLYSRLRANGIIVDVRAALAPDKIPPSLRYWSL
jgi:UDP-N-acetyl-D-galactosamine dehydrogenase